MRTLAVFAAAALALGLAAGPRRRPTPGQASPCAWSCPSRPAAPPTPPRIYAQHLGDYLGQSVVVENKAGAGGEIGAEYVAKSAPDGYTLLMGAVGSHAIHAAMPDKPGYDFGTAFVGVSMATSMPMALAVNSKVPARNVQELIALAKAKPGSITYGSAGPGTSQHMAGELFQVVTGTRLMHVPYRGSGPAITDLLGGQIDMVIETLPALLPQAASGKIRLLAVTTPRAPPHCPSCPR